MEGRKVTLKFSRREQEVVEAYERAFIRMRELAADDPREKIYELILAKKYGGLREAVPRFTPRPNWGRVTQEGACPHCLLGRTDSKLTLAGENLKCPACSLQIPKELMSAAKKRHEEEMAFRQEDEEFTKKVAKYEIHQDRLDELAELGMERAASKLGIKYPTDAEEEGEEPPLDDEAFEDDLRPEGWEESKESESEGRAEKAPPKTGGKGESKKNKREES